MSKYNEEEAASQAISEHLVKFVRPLLEQLDERLDKRLVKTFLGLFQVDPFVKTTNLSRPRNGLNKMD